MSDEKNVNANSENPASAGSLRPGRWYKTPMIALLLAAGLGTAGVVAAHAFGDGHERRSWRSHASARMEDPETMAKNMERGIRHLAIEIDASPAQEAALIELAKGAATDLHGFREMMQGEAGELAKLLTQPTVDRTAIEAFRAEKIEKVDEFTSRLTQVAVEAGEILTVEQRAKIAGLIAKEHEKRGGWRH